MKKILFICKRRCAYGTAYGLRNSARFVSNYLRRHNIASEVIEVTDANEIDKVVTEYNPTHVIIEALWVTPDKFKQLMNIERHQPRIWVVRLHSCPAFIANEGIAFPWLLEYRDIPELIVAPNTIEFTNDLINWGLNAIYLPNIYEPEHEQYMLSTFFRKNKREVHVGCFGAIRPLKNHLTQAIAAVRFAECRELKLRFHINSDRQEQGGERVIKNLRAYFDGLRDHELVERPWMPYPKFVELVKHMDIGMQCSFTETFNIVAADFVSQGIPIIGSQQISWLPKMFQVKDSNSTEEIANVLEFAYSWSGRIVKKLSNVYLNWHNKDAAEEWLDLIEE